MIAEGDTKGLTNYYYSLSTCLNTLSKMHYNADIHSTDVLRQALARLPNWLLRKWSEYSFHIRRREEPTLRHLERWLQDRVLAIKDPYLPSNTKLQVFHTTSKSKPTNQNQIKLHQTCVYAVERIILSLNVKITKL